MKKICLVISVAIGFQLKPIQAESQVLDALNAANLTTIPALSNSNSALFDSVMLASRLLFQVATLIETQSNVTSKRKADNTLVNSFEKFQYVAKGVFTKENILNAKSYEVSISEDAKVCRINLYQDRDFKTVSMFLRWRSLKDGAQFIAKIWSNNAVEEHHARIERDGGGSYECARDRKTVAFLKWDKFGNLFKGQTDER